MFNFFKRKREDKRRQEEAKKQEEDKLLKIRQQKEKEKAENERIKREEEERIIKRLLEDTYKEDMQNISLSIGHYLYNIMSNIKELCNEQVEKVVNITWVNIENFYKVVYRETIKINRLDEFERYAQENIERIIVDVLGHNFEYNYSQEYFNYETQKEIKSKVFEEFYSQTQQYNFNSYAYRILDDTKEFEYEHKIYDEIKEKYQYENNEAIDRNLKYGTLIPWDPYAKYIVSTLICLYSFLMTSVFLIILSRQKNSILENEELFKISENLYGQFNEEEAIDKLTPLYVKLYKGTIKGFDVSRLSELYIKQILRIVMTCIYDKMDNDRKNYIEYRKKQAVENGILDKVERLDYQALEHIMYRYTISSLYNTYIFAYYCIFVLFEYRQNISGIDLLYFIWMIDDIQADVYKRRDDKKLIEEKERFLKGDFTKEKEIENNRLKLESVETGIEFEQYLKYIFEKLGYYVEMTKGSGDQGADLILISNNIKTVVQAKFYSSTVGNKAVQEVVSAIAYYNADNGMVVTNNYYTKSAIELAEANNILLWDKNDLSKKIESLNY